MRLEPDSMGERAALLIDPEPTVDVQPEPVLALAEDPPARRTAPTPALRAAGRTLAGQSFEAFFETQYTQLLRAMYLVAGSRHEAEELAQETFLKAARRLPDDVGERFRSWLMRVGHNLAIDHLRGVRRERTLEARVVRLHAIGASAPQAVPLPVHNRTAGVWCIAAPLYDGTEPATTALSISMPTERYFQLRDRYVDLLLELTRPQERLEPKVTQ